MEALQVIQDLSFGIQNIVAGTAALFQSKIHNELIEYHIHLPGQSPVITLRYLLGLSGSNGIARMEEKEENTQKRIDLKVKEEAFEENVYNGKIVEESPPCNLFKNEPSEMLTVFVDLQEIQNKITSEDGIRVYRSVANNRFIDSEKNILTERSIGEILTFDSRKETPSEPQYSQHGRTNEGNEKNKSKKDENKFEGMRNAMEKQRLKYNYREQIFSTTEEKKRHGRIHIKEGNFNCDHCNKSFLYLSYLNRHKVIHLKERPFRCEICNKTFKRQDKLNQHQKCHTNGKPFQCKYCKKSFTLKADLSSHKRNHINERTFDCNYCGKSFSRNYYLICHQRTHTGERPYICEYCGKSFTYLTNLASHRRLHKGEKSDHCNSCGLSFTRKSHLLRHQRIHTGERPYTCEYCGKSFNEKTYLTSHKRLHTSERPYHCNVCGKSFIEKSNFNRHLYSIHTLEDKIRCKL